MIGEKAISVSFDHSIFVSQRQGGVSRYFVELANALSLLGADVRISTPFFIADNARALGSSIERTRLKIPAFPGVTKLGHALALMSRNKKNTDVGHSTWYPEKRPKNSRLFAITVHDMIAETYPTKVKGASEQIRVKAAAIRNSDLILCVSEKTKSDMEGLYDVRSKSIAVTPLASSIQHVVPADISVDVPYLLYVGQRGGYKNFNALAKAFLSSDLLRRNFSLVCFGGGQPTEAERRMLSGSSSAGPGRILFTQGDDRTLAATYRNAAAYVSPSLYEGFGLPTLEAMSCGCPVFASNLGATPEVGGTAVAYIGEPTVEAIRSVLEEGMFDSERLKALSLNGVMRSRSFSWHATASKTFDAYGKLLS